VLNIPLRDAVCSGAEDLKDVFQGKWKRDRKRGNECDTQYMGRYMMINTAEIYCNKRTGWAEL
jgi:hypothetical protein